MNLTNSKENRQIVKFKVNSHFINKILKSRCLQPNISFNLMVITSDFKVLLLQRANSFHLSKVVKDLKLNKIDYTLISTLQPKELEKISLMVPIVASSPIYIFPGGHNHKNEQIIYTLLREFMEETSINISLKDLRFNQSCFFTVLIKDLIIGKHFNNIIFPVKVNNTSFELTKKFKKTRHVNNLLFINILDCKNLYKAFLKVQQFMVAEI
jgi:hypothetical protein